MIDIKPRDGRIVFADTEFTTLDRRRREVWEIGLVIRDPGEEDVEVEWQVRPPLSDASPDSLRIARYYRRCLIQDKPIGTGLLIVGPQWPEITEEEAAKREWPEREVSAQQIAAQLARILDGAYVVGKVASVDELTLDGFLYQWEHALTTHYRTRCVETMAHGYLLGVLAERATVAGRETDLKLLKEQIPPPPWDPKVLAQLVGVQPPPPEQAHRALVDARLARDVWDAIHRHG